MLILHGKCGQTVYFNPTSVPEAEAYVKLRVRFKKLFLWQG